MPQKLGSSLIAIHHQDDFCFPLEGRFPSLPGRTTREKEESAISQLQDIFETLNAWLHLTKRFGQCSYGETRRLELGCCLTPHASLVVIDEPFSGLDSRWNMKISEILVDFAKSYESIWVITSHEPPEKFNINPNKILKLPMKPIAEHTFEIIAQAATQRFTDNPIEQQEKEDVHVSDLMVEYQRPQGSRLALRYLQVKPGTVTCLEGENGSGKSTIAQVLSGLLATSRMRTITVAGNIQGGPYRNGILKAPNDKIRVALQDPFRSFVCQTIEDDLYSPDSPRYTRGNARSFLSQSFWQQLNEGWGRTDRLPFTFSFGQLKFLQLLLIPSTVYIVIMDEPLLGLHPSLHSIMLSTLASIATSGRIVIVMCEPGVITSIKNFSSENNVPFAFRKLVEVR